MIRNFKALGLALVAAFAMSAVVASAAQAEKQYTSTQGHTTAVTGKAEDHVAGKKDSFTAAGGTITCNKSVFDITSTTLPASDLTVEATYSECTAFGLPATVTMNGCEYTFTTPTTGEDKNGIPDVHASVDLVCPAGKFVEIHIYGSHAAHTAGTSLCTITVEPSAKLKGVVTMTNIKGAGGTKDDVTIDEGTIEAIPYEMHKSSFLCPGSDTVTQNDGVYHVAPKTVKGFNSGGAQIDIDIG